jgi:hypothetical protein
MKKCRQDNYGTETLVHFDEACEIIVVLNEGRMAKSHKGRLVLLYSSPKGEQIALTG